MNARAWELIRAVRGPFVLITFGTVMALNHMDIIGFERTWPVLIIVYGIFKLLERMMGRPVPPSWPPAGHTASYTPYPPPSQYVSPHPPQNPHGGAQ